MPLLKLSTYEPPNWFKNNHIQTIYPALFRTVDPVPYERERIDTPDKDFLDLDWFYAPKKTYNIAIIVHGLDSNTHETYMQAMAWAFHRKNWDVLTINLRGCSEEMNRLPRLNHAGDTADLNTVLGHVIKKMKYESISLVGFSLGGNIVLKYMGEKGKTISPLVKSAVGISVPCDLKSAALHMDTGLNKWYSRRFINKIKKKLKEKVPYTDLTQKDVNKITNFQQLDDTYTAPIHGYKDAEEYWYKCSSKRYLLQIDKPTLLINAADDPFLTKECFPTEEATNHNKFLLEIPEYGGHVGFIAFNKENEYWHEKRTVNFCDKHAQH